MKKFIIAAVAASLISAPALAAPQQGGSHNNGPRVEQTHRGSDNRQDAHRDAGKKNAYKASWKRGERFDSRKARNYRVIENPRQYRLNAAPKGYRWVQSGNDAVLIGIASGIVASVMTNMMR